jgi:hypothetical protein
MDDGYLNQLAEYVRRSGRNLADIPGDAYNALAGVANAVPHMPFAEDGLARYGSALTGSEVPSYGEDEISAARAHFDRQPRSNTSRLVDLIGSAMPGSATGPRAFQAAGRANPAKAPVPNQNDSIQAIMADLRRGMAEANAQRGP